MVPDGQVRDQCGVRALVRRAAWEALPYLGCQFAQRFARPGGEPEDLAPEPRGALEPDVKGRNGYNTVTCAGTPQAAAGSSRSRSAATAASASGMATITALCVGGMVSRELPRCAPVRWNACPRSTA